MPDIHTLIFAYLAIVNIVAAGMTLIDKRASRCGAWRVQERTLFLAAALGGSVAMLLAMKAVRHKTKHAKFMVGIPVIIALQIAIAVFVWWCTIQNIYFLH